MGSSLNGLLGKSRCERPCERAFMDLPNPWISSSSTESQIPLLNCPDQAAYSRHCIPAFFHPSKFSWGPSCRGRSFLSYTEPDYYDRYIQVSSLQKRKAHATPLTVGLCLLFLPAARRFCFFFTSKSLLFGTACIRT